MKGIYSKLSAMIVLPMLVSSRLSTSLNYSLATKEISDVLSRMQTANLNAESHFALGLRFRLASADLYDLQLIPNLAEKVATQILGQREKVIMDYTTFGNASSNSVLTQIPGIGASTAVKISKYLVLR